jgi:hypothetical protein
MKKISTEPAMARVGSLITFIHSLDYESAAHVETYKPIAIAYNASVYGVAGIGSAKKCSEAECFARPYTSISTITKQI